jgi:hypothetical protein
MTSFSQVVSNVVDNAAEAHTTIFNILQQLTKEDKAVFACILWSIWKQRNNQIWNNVTDAQNFVFSHAINMLQTGKLFVLLLQNQILISGLLREICGVNRWLERLNVI